MYKKSPARNGKSEGVKVNRVLQICLLLGVGLWLVYQVKQSYDKTEEFDEKHVKLSEKAQNDDVIANLGRKDLPYVQEGSNTEKHEEEEKEDRAVEVENMHTGQEEVGKEEESSKHDEVVLQEENKHEFDHNKEEDSSTKETENKGIDGNNGEDRNINEAREEHYKASTAASHDIQTEVEKLEEKNSNEDSTTETSEQEIETNSTDQESMDLSNGLEPKVEEKQMEGDDTYLNTTTSNETSHDATNSEETNDESSNNSTESTTETNIETVEPGTATSVLLQNETASMSDSGATAEEESTQQTVELEQTHILRSSTKQSDAGTGTDNPDLVVRELPNWDETRKLNSTFGGEGSFGDNDASSATDRPEISSTSVTADEEDNASGDLGTLAGTRTEGGDIDDTAAE